MATKLGRNKRKPCKMAYKSQNRRRINKIRRITRCNGLVYLAQWKVAHPA